MEKWRERWVPAVETSLRGQPHSKYTAQKPSMPCIRLLTLEIGHQEWWSKCQRAVHKQNTISDHPQVPLLRKKTICRCTSNAPPRTGVVDSMVSHVARLGPCHITVMHGPWKPGHLARSYGAARTTRRRGALGGAQFWFPAFAGYPF